MSVSIIDQSTSETLISNYITGSFGSGKRVFIAESRDFVAPQDGLYRVRLWGGGGNGKYVGGYYYGGSGGGFSIKTIELSKGDSVAVSIALASGTTSFGSYFSATGGEQRTSSSVSSYVGQGVGGDINIEGDAGLSFGTDYTVIESRTKRTSGLSKVYPFLNSEPYIERSDIDAMECFAKVGFGGYGAFAGLGFAIVEY